MNYAKIIDKLRMLPPVKRAALVVLLKQQGIDTSQCNYIPNTDIRNNYPLSSSQERLWFLERWAPGQPTYNIPLAVLLEGNLNHTYLLKALNGVVEQQQGLRTVFNENAGMLWQTILPSLELDIPITEVTDYDDKNREVELWLAAASTQRFDLQNGPLVKASLLKINKEKHILFINVHHIVADGWSMDILIRSMVEAYENCVRFGEHKLEELKLQYTDFAVWQKDSLQKSVSNNQLEYWRVQLADTPKMLELPTDLPRGKMLSQRGGRFNTRIDPVTVSKLRTLANQHGCTLYMLLMATYVVLLYRYSGQRDICVGTPVACRHHDPELERLVGMFVNTLAIRAKLEQGQAFSNVLAHVKATLLSAIANQDVPFEILVKELDTSRAQNYTPFFQVMFVLHAAETNKAALANLELTQLETFTGTSKFELTLSLVDKGEDIEGFWEYNRDLFKGATIERMAGQYKQLLESILAEPTASIDKLSLLSAREYAELEQWSKGPSGDYDPQACLHDLVVKRAKSQSERIAVKQGNVSLTYGEIYSRASVLARQIEQLQLQDGQIVAVMLEQGWEQVVSVLAISMAGEAYLPININLPAPRREQLLELGNAGAVITAKEQSLGFVLPQGISLIEFQTERPIKQDNYIAAKMTSPQDLAYVIFTSGSTGVPKGVAIEHASALNTILDMNQRFAVGTDDVVLGLSELNFDLSVYDIFGALSAGATLVIPEPQKIREPKHWLELLQACKISIWNSVPALMQMMVEYLEHLPKSEKHLCSLFSVRSVWMSGDWIPPTLPDRIKVIKPDTEVISLGGATEASIWSISYPIVEPCSHLKSVPYGRALTNQAFYVLNGAFEFCPIGVSGDLYIGGIGIAREYWRDVVRTSGSFVNHPKTKERLYRTGDRGRWLCEGEIEFLGREDTQVKIRGFRIELGEIESTLNQYPGIDEAIAVVTTRQEGDAIVAYLVGDNARVSDDDLHHFLQDRLPSYMLPVAYHYLDSIPLSANGKIDRKALPKVDYDLQQIKSHVEARTETEARLAEIWCQVMGLDHVGIHDDFFQLGGHSMLAVRLISEIRDALDFELPTRTLFDNPTIAEIARLHEEALAA